MMTDDFVSSTSMEQKETVQVPSAPRFNNCVTKYSACSFPKNLTAKTRNKLVVTDMKDRPQVLVPIFHRHWTDC